MCILLLAGLLSVQVHASDKLYRFNIPTQAAGAAINAFARQAGQQVLFPFNRVKGIKANRLKGDYTVTEAIEILLKETGLRPVFSSDGVITIESDADNKVATEEEKPVKKEKLSLLAKAALFVLGVSIGQGATAQDVGSQAQAGEIEEIVVKGIKRSIQDALNNKRDASNIVDGISAEDFGKLPDQNLAESLQRITGVSINRVRGEGSRISVRGLGTNFNRVEINGRSGVSATSDFSGGGGRDFSFDVLPAQLVSAIEVYKSPTADMNEGGVGGTVNIKTVRPLDLGKRVLSSSVSGTYSELSDTFDPTVSVLGSNVFAGGSLGALVTASWSDRDLRQDGYVANGFSNIGSLAAANAGVAPVGPNQSLYSYLENNRERFGIAGALQWQPTDELLVSFDAYYAKLDETGTSVLPTIDFRRGVTDITNLTTSANNTLTSISGTNIAQPSTINVTNGNDNFTFPGETDFGTYGLNVDWNRDAWNVNGDVYYSRSTVDYPFERYFADYPNPDPFSYDFTSSRVPVVDFPAVDFTDPASFTIRNGLGVDITATEKEIGFRLDLEREIDHSIVTSIEFGGQYKERDREQDRNLLFGNTNGAPYPMSVDTRLTPAGFLSEVSGNFARQYVFANPVALNDFFFPDGIPFNSEFETFDFTLKEQVSSFHFKTNFASEIGSVPFDGNIGLRVVRTEQTSFGRVANPVGIDPAGPEVIFGPSVPTTVERTYSDLLWSANIKFELEEDFYLRFAAAEVMARPPTEFLSPATTASNGALRTITLGNPQIDPFRATQVDMSLEWYFADAGAIVLAAFYKDIDTFVTRTTTLEDLLDDPASLFEVTRPVNGEGGDVFGLELAYQQQFTFLPGPFDGLGTILNFTWVDSSVTIENAANNQEFSLEGLSDINYNAILYYEKYGFSGRLAYNYRSDFLERASGVGGNSEFFEEYGQLDFGLAYDFNTHYTVFVEGINVLDEEVVRTDGLPDRLRSLLFTGPRFNVGIRASF